VRTLMLLLVSRTVNPARRSVATMSSRSATSPAAASSAIHAVMSCRTVSGVGIPARTASASRYGW
jgi:hypothetical protein